MKIYLKILTFLFFLLCFGTLFLNSSSFVNVQTSAKWYAFVFVSAAGLTTLAVYAIIANLKNQRNLHFKNLVLPVCLIITILCFSQALYGIAQYMRLLPAIGNFKITGSFDNPAGFAACLCAGFPLFFYFLAKEKLWIQCVSTVGMMAVVLAVLFSGSRAGMLALAVVGVAGFYHLFFLPQWAQRISQWTQRLVAGTLLAILMTGFYFLKKDSADGRLLIWKCCWEMVKEKPLTGHGTGGFSAEYMNCQARYFEKHPDSKYVMLADNVNRPFNEYAGLAVNYGLVGCLLFLFLAFVLIRAYRRNSGKTILTRIACWCLIAIAVFALFSYPLRYPFVWVMGLLSCGVIIWQWGMPHCLKRALPVLILLLTPLVCIKSYNALRADLKWCKIARLALAGQTEQMLPEYKLLYSRLTLSDGVTWSHPVTNWNTVTNWNAVSNKRLFLYNYAAELNFAGHYEASLTIARECERLWADYDLQMLMADNCQKLKDYPQAEHHYRRAAAMCPVKFMPLYQLAKIYDATGRKSEALALAEKIITKPIKISSSTIIAIQREMRQLIEEEKNNAPAPESRTSNQTQNTITTRQGETPDLPKSGKALPP